MTAERISFLEYLKDSYSAYYDIIPAEDACSVPDLPLAFRADYCSRGEMYMLTKSAKIWGNEMSEYCYVFSAESMDLTMVKRCTDFALDDGLPRVKPHREHQYTNIKVVFLADSFEEQALTEVKKRSFQKTYNHSFWGYSNLISCAVCLPTEKVYTNRAGSDLKKYFSKLFAAFSKSDAVSGK